MPNDLIIQKMRERSERDRSLKNSIMSPSHRHKWMKHVNSLSKKAVIDKAVVKSINEEHEWLWEIMEYVMAAMGDQELEQDLQDEMYMIQEGIEV